MLVAVHPWILGVWTYLAGLCMHINYITIDLRSISPTKSHRKRNEIINKDVLYSPYSPNGNQIFPQSTKKRKRERERERKASVQVEV